MKPLRAWAVSVAVGLLPSSARADPAFPYGVASGDVRSDRAICWTRTTAAGDVRVEVARDEAFAQSITGVVLSAAATTGFAIKLDAAGLEPGTRYFFRFMRLDTGELSPVGSFITAPSDDAERSFRFLYSGDANADRVPFRLLDFAADESSDLWFFAGDTIYADLPAGDVDAATDRAGYRAKYAQSRGDAALQRLSAAAPVWVQWDDHEVANDYDGGDPEPGLAPQRIADAYEAFFENQPIRDQGVPADRHRIYRSFRYGTLAEFFLLDCRKYRSADAGRAGGGVDPFGYVTGRPEADVLARLRDPSRTMLGAEQLGWLKAGLAASTARWKFVLSSVTFTSLLAQPYDRWDGYDAERYELLRFIDDQRINGVVILSADIHGNAYNPDVTHYLRNSLGETFSVGFRIPEFVVGPIAQATFREELRAFLPSVSELPAVLRENPLWRALMIEWGFGQVRSRNRLAFFEPDRYAYLVADVSPGGVSLTHKGIRPGSKGSPAVLNTARLPEPGLCGVFPAPAAFPVALAGLVAVRRRVRTDVRRAAGPGRRASGRERRCCSR